MLPVAALARVLAHTEFHSLYVEPGRGIELERFQQTLLALHFKE